MLRAAEKWQHNPTLCLHPLIFAFSYVTPFIHPSMSVSNDHDIYHGLDWGHVINRASLVSERSSLYAALWH